MAYSHRSDCDDVCSGDWCTCPCHQRAPRAGLTDQDRQELQAQKAAIEAEAAKLRELHDALEGATEEVTPDETP